MVLRCTGKLRGTGIDRLHAGQHAQSMAICPHEPLVAAGKLGNLGIARAVLLQEPHGVRIDVLDAQPLDTHAHADHVADALDEPRIDSAQLMDARRLTAAAQCLHHREDAILGGRRDALGKLGIRRARKVIAAREQARATVLEGAHRFAERLFERANRSP